MHPDRTKTNSVILSIEVIRPSRYFECNSIRGGGHCKVRGNVVPLARTAEEREATPCQSLGTLVALRHSERMPTELRLRQRPIVSDIRRASEPRRDHPIEAEVAIWVLYGTQRRIIAL